MLHKVTFQPDDKSAEVRPGTTLLDAGRRARVLIRTRCNGKASCLMCKVKVADQKGLSPIQQLERQKLGELRHDQIRLACQARVQGTVEVMLPEDPLKAVIRAQLRRQQEQEGDFYESKGENES